MGVKIHPFVTSVLDEGEWSVFHSGRFSPWVKKKALAITVWEAGLYVVKKRKISAHTGN
jgi:hypothetical protein